MDGTEEFSADLGESHLLVINSFQALIEAAICFFQYKSVSDLKYFQ